MSALQRQAWATNSVPMFSLGSASGASLIPAGTVWAWAGTLSAGLPAGWNNCDGTSLSTTAYPDLFARIGYTYGGAGASFSVPNLTTRVLRGADAAFPSYALGTGGGADSVILSTNQIPAHTHPITDPGHLHAAVGLGTGYTSADGGNGNRAAVANTASATTGITVGNNTTTGLPVPTADPYLALFYIIKLSDDHA